MNPSEKYLESCHLAGCPEDQIQNLIRAGILLQPKQLAASAAARLCDHPDGPKAIGYGGARGGGKSHWLLSQMGADDCQRYPGLKCLLLRKVGKSNLENFEDLRQRLFHSLPHEFTLSRGGCLTFANGSRIILGHYQHEKEINTYLGLEYDIIGIDEATQLTASKFDDITSCCRTSKPGWRPRLYTTTNPGGLGHQWYYDKFIRPFESRTESATRFIPARVGDNHFIDPDYAINLANRTGWQYDAWYLGRWDFPAGQYFKNFRPNIHIFGGEEAAPSPIGWERAGVRVSESAATPFSEELARLRRFNESNAVKWIASMDYGYTHFNVVLLGCFDHADNLYIVDEHSERHWVPQRHAQAVKAMLARHNIYSSQDHLKESLLARFPEHCSQREALWHLLQRRMLNRFVAGTDMFSNESNGQSIARQYREMGLRLMPANMNRVSGWSAILQKLGDPAAGIKPSLFIHKRCTRLLETLPYLQHDPDRPGDLLKTNPSEDGLGGDDAADALRYLVANKIPQINQVKLYGF